MGGGRKRRGEGRAGSGCVTNPSFRHRHWRGRWRWLGSSCSSGGSRRSLQRPPFRHAHPRNRTGQRPPLLLQRENSLCQKDIQHQTTKTSARSLRTSSIHHCAQDHAGTSLPATRLLLLRAGAKEPNLERVSAAGCGEIGAHAVL